MLRLGNRQVVAIDLHGELDLSTGEEIAARINETLTSAGITGIAIDLADAPPPGRGVNSADTHRSQPTSRSC